MNKRTIYTVPDGLFGQSEVVKAKWGRQAAADLTNAVVALTNFSNDSYATAAVRDDIDLLGEIITGLILTPEDMDQRGVSQEIMRTVVRVVERHAYGTQGKDAQYSAVSFLIMALDSLRFGTITVRECREFVRCEDEADREWGEDELTPEAIISA